MNGVGAGKKMPIIIYIYGEKCTRQGRWVGVKIMSTYLLNDP